MKISVGLVDDHQLFLRSLNLLITSFGGYEVIIEAINGKDLMHKMKARSLSPDIMLVDVNMPVMGGLETVHWLHAEYPAMHLVALSMSDADKTIITMIKAGCCAYLLKDMHPDEFEKGLHEINTRGYYNADACNINYRRLLLAEKDNIKLTEKEMRFLILACSELTYKEIAVKMNLSERTIDGYREQLFAKFNVKTRVGLCLEAVRREMITL